ncbi:hypothetical protein BDA99DRAFT_21551 [Phascolomyces articulosus]|uniref:ARM repeat-containing protein n=1 Tax=Phascolomyces articulosus TaxID=60185 RepID=A0AAD5K2B6_9FUNG|nr:hypothetical protein BDA99DRAFT_21551 [Phascolomyces articulosus]
MDFWVSNDSNTHTRKHPPQGHPPGHTVSSRSPPLIVRTTNETLENLPGSIDQQPLRRARADTMPTPSFPYAYPNLTMPTTATTSNTESTRNRSGSVTTMFGYDTSPTDDSASSTVASTLASLGLDDENTPQPSHTEQQQQEEIKQRNRAYTVAAAALPQQQQHQMNRLGGLAPFTPFSPQTRTSVMQRPRAISLGMADGGGIEQPPSSSSTLLGASPYGHMFSTGAPSLFNPPSQQQSGMMLPTSSSIVPSGLAGDHRTLRSSRSSGNLVDLNNDVLFHHHRGFSRITSQSQLGELPEMAAANDFYSRMTGTTNLMESATSSTTQNLDGSPPSAPAQIPSRALWLGNINPSVSVPDLVKFFSDYGHVESARILSDKECAFVNFAEVESAIDAKNDLEGRLGSMLAGTPIRVGYGKADVNIAMALTNEAGPNAQGPTRALWVGNIPANMNPAILRTIFQPFGPIDSVRVLSHKNCGFVNFEHQEDAVRARKALQNNEILGPGTGMVRIGFAKVPSANEELDDMGGVLASSTSSIHHQQQQPSQQQQQQQAQQYHQQQFQQSLQNNNNQPLTPETYQATQWATAMMMTRMIMNASGDSQQQQQQQPDLHSAIIAERRFIMKQLGCETPEDVQRDQAPSGYSSVIPSVPEMPGSERKLDPLRLREIRKRLDAGPITLEEAEAFAEECKDEIVELCSDYIGNTVVQRIFENCSDQTKQTLLECIAPYLASIGVHKNGTWAAQKIIDHAITPLQIQLIRENLASYVPLLLLDQFGNYVVQCCLTMGADQDRFIFDAIVEKCWEIGQGRFGARAVRAILENPAVTKDQQIHVAASIVQNAVLLTTNTNGTLLLIWYLDNSTELEGRFRVLCPRLLPYLGKLCTHKLGSMIVLKIIHQQQEMDARHLLLKAIFNDPNVLDDILKDQVHGVTLVQKILGIEELEKRDQYAQQVKEALTGRLKVQHVQGYKKLFEQLDEIEACVGTSTTSSSNGNATDTTTSSPAATMDLDQVVNTQNSLNGINDGWMQNPQTVAMMANMYAAAMTAATTLQQQEQPPKVNTVDLAQFDSLLKTLLKQQEQQPKNDLESSLEEAQEELSNDIEQELPSEDQTKGEQQVSEQEQQDEQNPTQEK